MKHAHLGKCVVFACTAFEHVYVALTVRLAAEESMNTTSMMQW